MSPCPVMKMIGMFPVRRGELALQIEAALPRQSDIEHEAGGAIGRIGVEEVGNGPKQLNIDVERSQQTPDRGSEVRIVVDDQDGGVCGRHRCCSDRIAELSLCLGPQVWPIVQF